MRIYDISQEVFECRVYPGDRAPCKLEDRRILRGDLYNLTSIEMCVHNGTHVDAPYHFLENGETAECIPLEKTVGYCYVSQQDGDIDFNKAMQILGAANAVDCDASKRILLKGRCVVTAEAAHAFAASGVYLLGVESQTVGPENAPMEVHQILLSAKVVLLEGLCLEAVEEAFYFLSAAPLSLKGSDGAPCRALLIAKE